MFFQRSPDNTYDGKPGNEGIGWNCRMYRGSGSSSGLDVVSGVPYEVGKWTQVVVVYDPVDPVTNASLTIYVNGVAANANVWTGGSSGTDPGYVANASGSDVAPAVNSGSLGYAADGVLILGTIINTGPIMPGFESPNADLEFEGKISWMGLNRPSGLNVSGQITLEAWINPAATQGNFARIISHGPFAPSNYDPEMVPPSSWRCHGTEGRSTGPARLSWSAARMQLGQALFGGEPDVVRLLAIRQGFIEGSGFGWLCGRR